MPEESRGRPEEGATEEPDEELAEAARSELDAAAAAMVSLPFEDKIKLLTALPRAAAAPVTGAHTSLRTYTALKCTKHGQTAIL
jgi:hypothetical protein